ncbi:MAG TPA: serine/threonine-protein kinase [Kofleriaceae bacterium]
MAVKSGDTLEGRYKIIKTVGEGGMGTVYLAEHMLIKRKVAIKILRPELAADAAVVERFMNEARAAGAIGHPHIVESTDMGFTRDEVPFIVFEYLEGTLLTDEIYRVRGMPPRRALRIATQIASALHAAHSAGIIHRDLKSDNVFLTDKEDASDHVKVLDFGISRFLEAEAGEDSSSRHLVMGTPEFMAPEQILTPEKVDKRADIYALGVVLYEMLTARRPFDFDEHKLTAERRLTETDRLLHKIVTEPVPLINRFDLPPGLEELIKDKLLAKDPDQRFDSMKDVQGAFEAFFSVARRDSEPIPLSSTSTSAEMAATLATPPPSMAPKKKSGLGWLLAALLVGGTGAALLVVEPKPSDATVASNDAARKTLEEAAAKLAALLDTQTQASRMRAEGIGSLPMLRAAIETDAATLKDMVKDRDVLFKAEPNEVLEIFQVRDGNPSTMLRIPEDAPAIKPLGEAATRIETDGTRVHLIVGTPVVNQKNVNEGVIALSVPVDLTSVKTLIAPHTNAAALVGLDKPIVLAGTAVPASPVSFPIKTAATTKIDGLSLAAAVDSPAAVAAKAASPTFAYARFACWGLAGLLLVMFAVSRARKS